MSTAETDFQIIDAGSIAILNPISAQADAWVEEKVAITDETQFWGQKGIVVEHRYIAAIIDGILADGLLLEIGS